MTTIAPRRGFTNLLRLAAMVFWIIIAAVCLVLAATLFVVAIVVFIVVYCITLCLDVVLNIIPGSLLAITGLIPSLVFLFVDGDFRWAVRFIRACRRFVPLYYFTCTTAAGPVFQVGTDGFGWLLEEGLSPLFDRGEKVADAIEYGSQK